MLWVALTFARCVWLALDGRAFGDSGSRSLVVVAFVVVVVVGPAGLRW